MSSNLPEPIEENISSQNNTDIVRETTKEDFNEVLSLVEQFIEVRDRLEELRERTSKSVRDDLELIIQDYNSLLEIIDSETSPVEIVQTRNLSGRLRKNKVERLGIAGELIRLRKEGSTINELSKQFNLARSTISRFFRYYDSLQPSQKSKYQRKSIFEVTERLEELQTLILRNLHRLEGTRDEVAVKWGAELRQTLELAVKVAEKINDEKQHRREYEEFKETVYEILVNELNEDQRMRVIEKLKNITPSSETLE